MQRRLIAALTAAVLAGGLATAAPTLAAPVQVQASSESTEQDKVVAAAILGINAGEDLLILRDRDFVFAMWQRATGREVRAAAELAFAGTIVECTQFIKNGLREANQRDQAQEIRDEEAARIAREAKQAAAAAIGIIAEPELLIQSDKDFVFAIWQRSDGPKVKAAALVAYNGTPEMLTQFITEEIFEARKQDQLDEIEANQEADAAEKARLAARAAKLRAAAVIRVVASEGMLIQPDENFVFDIWMQAPQDSEVQAAAYEALLSGDPAVITAYINTEIHLANKRDLATALRKKAESDRRQALTIQAKAENSGVHPRLAEAARAALTGTDAAVAAFLRVGQYDYLVQSLEATTPGVRGWSVRRNSTGNAAVINTGTLTPGPGDGVDASWKIVTGLADPNCHSFESVHQPGHYLRVKDFRVLLVPSDGSTQFLSDATWCARRSTYIAGGMSFEAKNLPGRLLRHYNSQLWAAANGGPNASDATNRYLEDTTWKIQGPNPTVTAIWLRYLNDDVIRARIGDPVGAEVVDGAIRWREFRSGRMYWTAGNGPRALNGAVLTEYLRLGGYTNPRLGLPVYDTTALPLSLGQQNQFAANAAIYNSASTGAHAVYGKIKDLWTSLGSERSWLRYPTGDETDIPDGKRQLFQGGRIDWNATTNVATAVPK